VRIPRALVEYEYEYEYEYEDAHAHDYAHVGFLAHSYS
jgi:hypothetical protein